MANPPNQTNLWWGECLSQLKGTGLTPKEVSVFWRQGKSLGLINGELCDYTTQSAKQFISERIRMYSEKAQVQPRSRPIRRSLLSRSFEFHPYQRPPAPLKLSPIPDELDLLTQRFGSLSSNPSCNSDEDDIQALIDLLNDL